MQGRARVVRVKLLITEFITLPTDADESRRLHHDRKGKLIKKRTWLLIIFSFFFGDIALFIYSFQSIFAGFRYFQFFISFNTCLILWCLQYILKQHSINVTVNWLAQWLSNWLPVIRSPHEANIRKVYRSFSLLKNA